MREIGSDKIDWNQKCWRYFKMERFIDALENGHMYFSAADEFEDKFEGATYISCYDDENLFDDDKCVTFLNNAVKDLQRLTKISCWHKSNHESDLMWKIYAQDKKGIAITTTPERMRVAFQPYKVKPEYGDEDIYIGNVKYLDLTMNRIVDSMLGVFYYKHLVFKMENELRLTIPLSKAQDFGVSVPSKGIFVLVDYSILIEEIIIGPEISIEDYNCIMEVIEKMGFTTKVKKSCLTYTPVFI